MPQMTAATGYETTFQPHDGGNAGADVLAGRRQLSDKKQAVGWDAALVKRIRSRLANPKSASLATEPVRLTYVEGQRDQFGLCPLTRRNINYRQ